MSKKTEYKKEKKHVSVSSSPFIILPPRLAGQSTAIATSIAMNYIFLISLCTFSHSYPKVYLSPIPYYNELVSFA